MVVRAVWSAGGVRRLTIIRKDGDDVKEVPDLNESRVIDGSRGLRRTVNNALGTRGLYRSYQNAIELLAKRDFHGRNLSLWT